MKKIMMKLMILVVILLVPLTEVVTFEGEITKEGNDQQCMYNNLYNQD